MIDSPRWSKEQLETDRAKSITLFREARLLEPIESYSKHFDSYWGVMDELLEMTTDLSNLSPAVVTQVLSDANLNYAFRYLPGPPISSDDLETLVDCPINARELKKHENLSSVVADTVMDCLDRRRFPWVTEKREPSEPERGAAVTSSAALMAYQKSLTSRRTEGKEEQEKKVHDLLVSIGFKEIPRKLVPVLADAPKPGEFCGEAKLSTRKADFIIGGLDRRTLAIECKVSNSSLNSVKRLNNDAAAKAESWIRDLGRNSVIPIAVLSGVYKLANLTDAQERGLTLFWAHDLEALGKWIKGCASASQQSRQ